MLFNGALIDSINHVSFIYQAIMLLEESKYELSSCQEGDLTKWFMSVRQRMIEKKQGFNGEWFRDFDKVVIQRKLWNEEISNLEEAAILGKRDSKRTVDTNQKIILWNLQNGECKKCGGDLDLLMEYLSDIIIISTQMAEKLV